MVGWSSTSQATHTGTGGGIVVDGLDAVVHEFTRKAATLQPEAGVQVVRFAAKAADRMRATVPIGPPAEHVLDTITSDPKPTIGDGGVYADAGPDSDAGDVAFVARFLENGTVKMSPRPFVGPAADKTIPEFVEAIGDLGDLDA